MSGGDLEAARKVAARLRAGQVNINGAGTDLMAPFGGFKQSGNGREWGDHAFAEFLEVKAMLGYAPKRPDEQTLPYTGPAGPVRRALIRHPNDNMETTTMASINEVIDLSVEDGVAVVTSNSPPVNALSALVRDGLTAAFDQVFADDAVQAVVLICAGRTFFAGADISEFGKPPKGASLHALFDRMERPPSPSSRPSTAPHSAVASKPRWCATTAWPCRRRESACRR